MLETIDSLLEEDALALHFRQTLEPVDGRDVPIYPSTYPAPRNEPQHRHDTPYTVNQLRDGTWVATLDSIPSQANRMESCFGKDGELAGFIPTVGVRAGGRVALVGELGHRIAAAEIRATELHEPIRQAFEAFDGGDPAPIARLCPMALIYGAWDSRDTQVKIPRLVRAEVIARDVDVLTRSVQFSGTFTQDDLGLKDGDWKAKRGGKAAEAGFAPTPAVNEHGGVIPHGEIVQSVAIHLGAMKACGDRYEALPPYLLSLALAALLSENGGRDYTLRAGCWLVPAGAPDITLVTRQGQRTNVSLDFHRVCEWLEEATKQATAEPLGIRLGEDRIKDYDKDRALKLLEEAKKKDSKE